MEKDLKIIAIKIWKSNTTWKFKWKLWFFDNNWQRYLYKENIKEEFPELYKKVSIKWDWLIDYLRYDWFLDIFNFENWDVLIITL